MATFDIKPQPIGVTLTLISDDHSSSISKDFASVSAEQFVRMFCQAAGLPEPWKQG